MTPLYRRALMAILVVGLLLRLGVLLRPLGALDGLAIPDDCYLSLEIAKNIGLGNGPLHGREFTNGFQPLYVFLAAPIFAVLGPAYIQDIVVLDFAVKSALTILMLFDMATGVLLAAYLGRKFGWSTATLCGVTTWMAHPTVLATSANGLETSMAVTFLMSSLLLYELVLANPGSRRWMALLGVSFGLGCLARIDHFLLGGIIGFHYLFTAIRGRGPATRTVPFYAVVGACFLAVYTPWLFYSWHYTGQLYPVSGRAVRNIAINNANGYIDAAFHRWVMGLGLARIWDNSPIHLVLLPVFGGIAAVIARGRIGGVLRSIAIPLCFVSGLYLAYTLYILGYWFFDRYLFPVLLVLIIALVGLMSVVEPAVRFADRRLFAKGAVGLALLACAAHPLFLQLFLSGNDPNAGYRNPALWVRNYASPGAILGVPQSGAMAYYRNGYEVLNLDGVVNQRAYAALRETRLQEYIAEQRITMIVGWPADIDFIKKNSSAEGFSALEYSGTIPVFRSWGQPWLVYTVEPQPSTLPQPAVAD